MSTANSSSNKILLNEFLKVLNSSSIGMQRAMAIASKIYKSHNTPAQLGRLTDETLRVLGVDKPEDRRAALSAFRKAGYRSAALDGTTAAGGSLASTRTAVNVVPKTASAVATASGLGKRKAPLKRKRGEQPQDDYAPKSDSSSRPTVASPSPNKFIAEVDNFEFNEVLDSEALRSRSVVVNRAPVMAVWAMIVAERLGFRREEALSIGSHEWHALASVYTEMNAISKGTALGIYEKGKGKDVNDANDEAQPYVDLMGRRPLYQSQSGQWHALLRNEPVEPVSALSYVKRSFQQTLPYAIGAMRLLAHSFRSPKELNEKGYALYMAFRPGTGKWGERARMQLSDVLDLIKKGEEGEGGSEVRGEEGEAASIVDMLREGAIDQEPEAEEPSAKKPRLRTSADSYLSDLSEVDRDPLAYGEEL